MVRPRMALLLSMVRGSYDVDRALAKCHDMMPQSPPPLCPPARRCLNINKYLPCIVMPRI